MSLIPYTRELGPVLDRWFEPWGLDLRPASRAVLPPVDASSDDDGLTVRLEVPGVPPKALTVETHERTLQIRTESEEDAAYRGFQRSFRLPADLDVERAEAKHEHGVLTIRIPRSEAAKPHRIEVRAH